MRAPKPKAAKKKAPVQARRADTPEPDDAAREDERASDSAREKIVAKLRKLHPMD